ncbi:MAG: GAF domain-containing sensor histidine kinase [Anaerolineae bacterium]|nr:GAF domain-containing sensor histidine kinase [Anaerolineae bacterium]
MTSAEKRVQRLERMLAVSRDLTSTVRLAPLLRKIVATAAELTESLDASILLWDVRTGELRFQATAGDEEGKLAAIPVPVEGSIAGTVLTSGQPIIVTDARRDPRHYDEVGQQIGREINSLVAVPMQIKDRCIGVLEAVNKMGSQGFTDEDVETLMTLGAHAAVAIDNARLVAELQDAYKRLGELDHLKSDFIAIASHELRTPLGLILGYASLLRDHVGEKAGSQLDVVLRSALRLKHLIETMLNLRYLETGELELCCSRFDLRHEVQQACDSYRALVEAHCLNLEVDVPDAPLLVWGDEQKIRVVLDNLISNAVRFTPEGGHVWVSAVKRRHQVEVAVVDDGVGIPKDSLRRVFERFEQVEDHMTRRHGGMGLGLAIVKGLVELHGGRVWVDSAPDQGSRFVFVLPCEPPPGASSHLPGPDETPREEVELS